MMLTPCGPSAVPTGGAGVALPAGICSLTNPVTFLAISLPHACGRSDRRGGGGGRGRTVVLPRWVLRRRGGRRPATICDTCRHEACRTREAFDSNTSTHKTKAHPVSETGGGSLAGSA